MLLLIFQVFIKILEEKKTRKIVKRHERHLTKIGNKMPPRMKFGPPPIALNLTMPKLAGWSTHGAAAAAGRCPPPPDRCTDPCN